MCGADGCDVVCPASGLMRDGYAIMLSVFRVRSPATNGALGVYVYRARSQVATCQVHYSFTHYIHITCCTEGLHPSTHRANRLAESHMC
eukprot:1183313-Prorocentrum_minimum.AAC.1